MLKWDFQENFEDLYYNAGHKSWVLASLVEALLINDECGKLVSDQTINEFSICPSSYLKFCPIRACKLCKPIRIRKIPRILFQSLHLFFQDGGGSIDIDEVIKLVIGLFAIGGVEVIMISKHKSNLVLVFYDLFNMSVSKIAILINPSFK